MGLFIAITNWDNEFQCKNYANENEGCMLDKIRNYSVTYVTSLKLNPHAKAFIPHSEILDSSILNVRQNMLDISTPVLSEVDYWDNIYPILSFIHFCFILSTCLHICICTPLHTTGSMHDGFSTSVPLLNFYGKNKMVNTLTRVITQTLTNS